LGNSGVQLSNCDWQKFANRKTHNNRKILFIDKFWTLKIVIVYKLHDASPLLFMNRFLQPKNYFYCLNFQQCIAKTKRKSYKQILLP
jgi:hypothetical protein